MTTELTASERRLLLEQIRDLRTDADDPPSVFGSFLPLPSHRMVYDPRVIVVLGGKGTGKTTLFRALREAVEHEAELPFERNFHAIFGQLSLFPEVEPRAVIERAAIWAECFSELGAQHPSPDALARFVARPESTGKLKLMWTGLIVRAVHAALPDQVPSFASEFIGEIKENPHDVPRWLRSLDREYTSWLAWLDAVNATQKRLRTPVMLSFDHLDRVLTDTLAQRDTLLRALLAVVFNLRQRGDGLHPKVFLRSDLFERAIQGNPDGSKLIARSISLEWRREDLMRMVVRHLANGQDALRTWLTKRALVEIHHKDIWGWMPSDELPSEGDRGSQESLMTALVGRIMGQGPTKGYSHKWIISHSQDAHGVVAPRVLLNVLRRAAEQALAQGPAATGPTLLTPTELQAGLILASKDRVHELLEEHPVVSRMWRLEGEKLPVPLASALTMLTAPGQGVQDHTDDDPPKVLALLKGAGMVIERPARPSQGRFGPIEARLDVPEVYRYAFNMKRRGGVKLPH
jgi:energy-coupling factor transporter ATP-binding protein EcfA2